MWVLYFSPFLLFICFGINRTKLCTYLRFISCSPLLAFVSQAATFWQVFNGTSWERELSNYLLWLCSIQVVVNVVYFSWIFHLGCAFLKNVCPDEEEFVFLSLKRAEEHTRSDRMLGVNTNT